MENLPLDIETIKIEVNNDDYYQEDAVPDPPPDTGSYKELQEKCGEIFLFKTNKILKFICKFCETEVFSIENFTKHIFEKHFTEDSIDEINQSLYGRRNNTEVEDLSSNSFIEEKPKIDLLSNDPLLDIKSNLNNESEASHDSQLSNSESNSRSLKSKNKDENIKSKRIDYLGRPKGSAFKDKRGNICQVCNKKFGSTTGLKDHMNIHTGDRPYKCSMCPKSFRSKQNLNDHERRHKGEAKFACSFCDKKLYSKGEKIIHERIHTGERPCICDICGMRFTSKSTLTLHKATHTNKIIKSQVNSEIIINEKVTNQLENKTEDKSLEGNNIINNSNEFALDTSLMKSNEEIKTERIDYLGRPKGGTYKDRKNNKCEFCGKIFNSVTALSDHINIHTGARPYNCSICPKSFRSKQNLYDHERRHKGEAKFPCEFCDKKLYSNGEKVIHERIHTGERPCICEICGMGFTSKSTLTLHLATHNPIKILHFKCEICGKAFPSNSKLNRHNQVHENKVGSLDEVMLNLA